MSYIDDFKLVNKKRKIYTALCLVFWIPAMALGEIYDPAPREIILLLKIIGVAFILMAVFKHKCPKCKKTPGWGWYVENCKSCGEPLA
jgi:hypothetical protein